MDSVFDGHDSAADDADGQPGKPRTHRHLIRHFDARQTFEKYCGAKGIRTPDLLHAMQTRYQLRHSPSCTTLEKSLVKEARPAPQSHSLAPASVRLACSSSAVTCSVRRLGRIYPGRGPGGRGH